MSEPRYKTVSEVHLVLQSSGKTLLLQRFQTGYMDGFYSLPAGHVDAGETFRSAIQREAAEEAGIEIAQDDLKLAHTMHRYDGDARLSLFFTAAKWVGSPRNMEPHKCTELDWHDPGEKADKMVPYVAEALELLSQGISYSEHGWGVSPANRNAVATN